MVNEVLSEHGNDALLSIAVARKTLEDHGVTEKRQIAAILRRSRYAQDDRLNLLNTLELF